MPPEGVGRFLHGQLFITPPVPTADLSGQTIIVTGGSAGLGLHAAHYLIRQNVSTLIIAVRNTQKGESARSVLLEDTAKSLKKNPKIEVWELDVSSYASVISFAKKAAGLPRLDVLLLNAGVLTTQWSMYEGMEKTIQTNVLGNFLLAILMLPTLRKSATTFAVLPRIVLVGSAVHFFAEKKQLLVPGNVFDELAEESRANMVDRYNLSMLVKMFMVRELAERLSEAEKEGKPLIVVNAPAPGLCKTNLLEEGPPPFKVMLALIGRSADVGARCLVDAVGKGRETHGQYLSESQVKPASAFIQGKQGAALQKKLWSEMMDRLEKVHPGIEKII